jgi:hypothetical protein
MTTFHTSETETRSMCKRLVDELRAKLHEAEALLRSLHRAKQESETRLSEENRADAMKLVTGRSAIESAIESTRHLIERLRSVIVEAQRALASGCVTPDVAHRLQTVAASV